MSPSPLSSTLTLAAVLDGTASLERFRTAITTDKDVAVNRLFVEGDHWQGGDAWVGPGPKRSAVDSSEIMLLIEKAFVSRNVIDECIDRLVSAILGKSPDWTWAPDRPMADDEEPTEAEQTLINEVDQATTKWWQTRQAHTALKKLIYNMLWARRQCGRLYTPPGSANAAGRVTANKLDDALLKIYFDVPEPEDCGVWEDPETKRRVGVVFYKDDTLKEHAEVTFVDDAGLTVTRLLPEGTEVKNDFGGAMPIFQVELDQVFINEQMRSLNRSLNMTMTLLQKGLIDNHFLERLMLNAMPPGHWEYETEPDGAGGFKIMRDEAGDPIRKAYIKDAHVTGGRITNYVQGVDFKDEQGRTNIKDPSVVFRDPTDPTGTIKGAAFWYASMLDEARQAHVLLNKATGASDKSREQARGDFEDSTRDPQAQGESAGRELLLTLVRMGELIGNMKGKYTSKLKPVFACRPTYGPLSVEERAQNILEAKDGYRSDANAMSLNGVDDTDAEAAAIQAQPRAALALATLQAEAVKAWVDAGFTHEVALTLIGLDEAEVKRITKLNAETTVDPEPVKLDKDGKPIPAPAPKTGPQPVAA